MVWLSIKKVSSLLDVSERAVQLSKTKYKYKEVDSIGRGGKSIVIALESLPQKIQDKYNDVQEERIYDVLDSFTGKQRDEAHYKERVVKRYQQSGLPPDKYIAEFNQSNPYDTITKAKLFRWQNALKNKGIIGLIDGRGGYNRGKDTIPDEAWDIFYALYITTQRRSVQRCWELAKMDFGSAIPSVSTFERKVQKLPELVIRYYRYGEKAFNDSLPYMERSRLDINSNDIWFSDHHKLDVAVKNERGKVVRPWLTVFYDARSNKVISFIMRDKAADATVVKQCLRIGMEEYGVPKEVYFDNGKDYKEKSFSKDFPVSLSNQLGINTIYATKFHGQAKTVERFFGTLTDRFCKLIPTYLGKDAKERPENMQVTFDKLESIAPNWEEFTELLGGFIQDYNNTQSRGNDMENKCPDQVYFENLKSKKEIHDKNILRLLCGSFEERTILSGGNIQFQNRHYYHAALMDNLGKRVIINYDPYNVDELNVFDKDMRAICIAPAKVQTPFRHTTQEDYRAAAKEKKIARKLVAQYAPVREVNAMAIIAKNQLSEKIYSESNDTTVIDAINPKMTENSRIFSESAESVRVSRDAGIGAALMKKYNKEKQAIGG